MELRSRSRSKTPFFEMQTVDSNKAEEVDGTTEIRRTTRRTVYKVTGNALSTTNSKVIKGTKTQSFYQTSDYSSEEGDFEAITKRHITQNDRNQIIEDARAAANGSSEISALNLYRKAGRYWDKYPKTDWTYSPHSKDRVEIAPGVVAMPNMSRPTIHSIDKFTNTESVAEYNESEYYNNLSLDARYTSYMNNNDEIDSFHRMSSLTARSNSAAIKRTFRLSTIITTLYAFFYYMYQMLNLCLIWSAKKLHQFVSAIMLMDTWILRRRRVNKTVRGLLLLCLIPLFLFACWPFVTYLSGIADSAFSYLFIKTSTDTNTYSPLEDNTILTNNNNEKIIEITKEIFIKPDIGEIAASLTEDQLKSIANFIDIRTKLNLNNIQSMPTSKEYADRASEDDQMKQTLLELRNELNAVKLDLAKLENVKIEELHRLLNTHRTENVDKFAKLMLQLNRCCNKPMIYMENYVRGVVSGMMHDHLDRLKALLVAKSDLEMQLANITQMLNAKYDSLIENNANVIMEKISKEISHPSMESLSDERVKAIVKSALEIYDADKTGLVDYAMEPMGGQLLTTRCTEAYHTGTAVMSLFGFPVWFPTKSPRTVITPGISPGECWAFQNFPGFVVIKLANKVRVEAFTMEHISKLLVPKGSHDSAPREFEVYGLIDENDKEPVKLGEYVYDINGDPMQHFAVWEPGRVFEIVELRINSNHGNLYYTCLYRFRVHGSIT